MRFACIRRHLDPGIGAAPTQNLSTAFAAQKVGVAQVSEHIWLVSFMDYDLG